MPPLRSAALIPLAPLVLSLWACGAAPSPAPPAQKLVILGFDGLDPDLVQRWMAEGKLPNMKRLADQGGMYPLQTTHSPESPTAWASFATGVNAGKHNIYDFLVRDTATYLPDLGMVRREPARFLFGYFPVAPPRVHSTRGGTSFWVTAGRAGVRSSILTVPVTFPPEEVPNGELLAGLPLPDLRGTMGTFQYFATDLGRHEEGDTEMGGILHRLAFEDDVARSRLTGPPDPIVRQQIETLRRRSAPLSASDRASLEALQRASDLTLPLAIRWNRAARTAVVDIDGQSVALEPGRWSPWIDLEFRANLLVRVRGMVQMRLLDADRDLRLYVSPINWKPDAPPVPMSHPEGFAADLAARVGPYRTLGWAEATWALNEGRIDEAVFMEDLYRAFDDRAQVILSRLGAREWDLLVGVIESPDRVQHMLWRLTDPEHPRYDAALAARFGREIERVYRRADGLVGEALELIDPDTPVLIVSDHGFHPWRRAVNLNTWLVQEGYMTLTGAGAGKTLDDLFGGGTFWEHVDWRRTRAYAMGLGQIYLNLRGREALGTVEPGSEADRVRADLRARLLTFRDPEGGRPIVRSVHAAADIYTGPYLANAPDLQVGMHEGYRVSWQTTLGGAPPGLVYDNDTRWSADHGGFDAETTAGVLIANRRVQSARPAIVDIAPTVLQHFGLHIAADIDGSPLF